jgi:hypothetical protein
MGHQRVGEDAPSIRKAEEAPANPHVLLRILPTTGDLIRMREKISAKFLTIKKKKSELELLLKQ